MKTNPVVINSFKNQQGRIKTCSLANGQRRGKAPRRRPSHRSLAQQVPHRELWLPWACLKSKEVDDRLALHSEFCAKKKQTYICIYIYTYIYIYRKTQIHQTAKKRTKQRTKKGIPRKKKKKKKKKKKRADSKDRVSYFLRSSVRTTQCSGALKRTQWHEHPTIPLETDRAPTPICFGVCVSRKDETAQIKCARSTKGCFAPRRTIYLMLRKGAWRRLDSCNWSSKLGCGTMLSVHQFVSEVGLSFLKGIFLKFF